MKVRGEGSFHETVAKCYQTHGNIKSNSNNYHCTCNSNTENETVERHLGLVMLLIYVSLSLE
jgi:hypothetical protein